MVPVGVAPPATRAVSATVAPSGTNGMAAVEMVGAPSMTITDSPGSPHAPATALLAGSPE
jgi:hypothetical protein